jgi:hypothetical protein
MNGKMAGDDDRRFLGEVLAALGWDQPDATKFKTEAHALAEIRRLRADAGEGDEGGRTLMDMEHLSIDQVSRVGGDPRLYALWLTTRAGVVERSERQGDGPWKKDFVEHPPRNLVLRMDEDQARQIHDILADKPGRSG